MSDLEVEQFGKYRVTGKIGTGSMGQVFLAKDPVLKREVAVKTMSAKTAADDQLVQRFQREAQSAARLNHPNIITVYDFGEEQGQFYMAMELLKGKDLKDLIGGARLRSLRQKLDLMEQICDGVGFAHSRGVIHRDLKPGNIHVQPNGRVKILDFGLARPEDSEMTQAGMVMGTPNYMSPEQVRGQKADPRSDVFSLGAVFYEVLCARRAFRAETMHKILERVLVGQPDPVKQFVPGVPESLVTVIDRALNKTPADRYQDAAELGSAIKAVRTALTAEQLDAGSDTPGLGLADPEVTDTLAAASQATVLEAGPTLAGGSVARGPGATYAPRGSTSTTLHGRAPTQIPTAVDPPPRSPLPLALAVGMLLLVIAVGAGVWVTRDSRGGGAVSSGDNSDFLTDIAITTQLEIAQLEYDSKNYDEAIAQAQGVLALDADNADATALIEEAQAALDQIRSLAATATTAFDDGDVQAASSALSQVLTLDPGHPVVDELSPKLNQHFRSQATSSRAAMEQTRTAAAEYAAGDGFRRAEGLAAEAEAAMEAGTYVVAAQRFLAARDLFDRHRREGLADARAREAERRAEERRRAEEEERRRQAAVTTTLPPTPVPTAAPSATPTPPPTVATPTPARATPTPRPTPVAPTPPPAPTLSPQEVAVRAVLGRYAEAYEGRNMNLLKQIWPSFSDEKRLAAAFKQIERWQVGISIESVEIQGGRARVVVGRQDVVNGTETPRRNQVFTLVDAGGSWVIESVGG